VLKLPPSGWADMAALWVLVGGLLAYRGWHVPGTDFECTSTARGPCLRCARLPYIVLMMGVVVSIVIRQIMTRQSLHRNPYVLVILIAVVADGIMEARSGGDLAPVFRREAKRWPLYAAAIVVLEFLTYGLDCFRLIFAVIYFFALSRVALHFTRRREQKPPAST